MSDEKYKQDELSRENNLHVIRRAFEKLASKTWFPGTKIEIPVKDLIVNGKTPDNCSLLFSIGDLKEDTDIVLRVKGTDGQYARFTWSLHPMDVKNTPHLSISTAVLTFPDYEGNGYSAALLSLTNVVIEKAIQDLHLRQPVIFSVISDSAEGQGDKSRSGWTTSMVKKHLPNFTNNLEEIKQRLGFIPEGFQPETDAIAVYRQK